jgi:hypothetical protein
MPWRVKVVCAVICGIERNTAARDIVKIARVARHRHALPVLLASSMPCPRRWGAHGRLSLAVPGLGYTRKLQATP